ncbi:MAG: hypothetical protein VCE74_22670 [Alphaproteobacteria bacterium]
MEGEVIHAGEEFVEGDQKRHAAKGDQEPAFIILGGNTVFAPIAVTSVRLVRNDLQFPFAPRGGDLLRTKKKLPSPGQVDLGGMEDVDQVAQLKQRRVPVSGTAVTDQKQGQALQDEAAVPGLAAARGCVGQGAEIAQELAVGTAANKCCSLIISAHVNLAGANLLAVV